MQNGSGGKCGRALLNLEIKLRRSEANEVFVVLFAAVGLLPVEIRLIVLKGFCKIYFERCKTRNQVFN